MKTIINISLITLLLFGSTAIFWAKDSIDNYDILIKKWLINKSEKRLSNSNITKAKFWKVALTLAWYDDSEDKKVYVVPINGIKPNQWYSKYAKESFRLWLLDRNKEIINPIAPMRKLEAMEFAFKLFGVSTPYYQDVIMDFKDVMNDHPIVSQCLIMRICSWENDHIFWANKPLEAKEAYKILVDTYIYVYWDNPTIQNEIPGVDILKQMINAVETEYYLPEDVNIQKFLYWAMEWFADEVWDKYSIFMRPEVSENFNDSIDWSFEWIWAYIEKDELWIKIITPINWSPAQKAWLKANDIILEADWYLLKELSFQEAIKKIKWPSWSKVELKIKRDEETFYVPVVRKKVEIPSIEKKIESNVLIVKINQFNKNTDEQLEEIFIKNKNLNSIVIDLRSNPWWYLDTAENILSLFIETWKPILQIKYPNQNNIVKASDTSIKIKNKNIAVLIDQGSASASEILAWTLKDYKIAKILWEKSFWKWTVQTIEQYYDWSQFKYTIAQWLTAKWNSIQDTWVTPDVVIKDNPDSIWDDVLERAKKLVR